MGYFLVGLQLKIRHQIRSHDPKELMRALGILIFDTQGVQE